MTIEYLKVVNKINLELEDVLKICLNVKNKPTIINIMIDPAADRKAQE